MLIEAASFLMGSEHGPPNERPIRRVRIDAFELGATQVTNAEYAAFLESTNHPPPPTWNDPNFNHPRQPVVSVSWFDATRYCEWLGAITGRRVRLPTEAEWECAARGGVEGRLYPWGDDPPETRPEYGSRRREGPEPVARFAPNAFGLHDICGNVHEWCGDWYAADYYAVSIDANPRGPESGTRRVSRGGSWRHQVQVSRCAARASIPPDYRYADYGFRVAEDRLERM